MSKIILVYPMSRRADTIEHSGIAYLSAAARDKGHEVHQYVYHTKQADNAFLTLVDDIQPDLIGFSLFWESTTCVLELCTELKQRLPGVHLTLGGHAATQAADYILKKYPQVDTIVRGEGERTLCELLEALTSGQDLAEVTGLAYRDKAGKPSFSPPRQPVTNLDELPLPARDIFAEASPRPTIMLLSTSRGCLAHCSFCSYSSKREKGARIWRGRSPEHIVAEIAQLVDRYTMNTFFITDVTYEDPGHKGKERIKEIATEILRRKLDINYEVHMRAENWQETDRPLLALLHESGLESVVVGIESGSEHGLQVYDKKATVADNYRIVQLLREYQISLEYGFIMFNPYTTFTECRENIAFLKNAGLGYNISCTLTRLEVFPGTGIEERLRRDGLLCGEGEDNFPLAGGIFSYRHTDPRIETLARHLCSLPERLDCINAFDEFNTALRVFMARIVRRYAPKQHLTDIVKDFLERVESVSREMTFQNMAFLEQVLALAEKQWNEERFAALVDSSLASVLPARMAELKKLKMECCLRLTRAGASLALVQ